MHNEIVKESISIDAAATEVWKALITPELVKQYFFGTNLQSDWKEGNPITYSGTWQGREYKDKGMILQIEKDKKLRHTHWSSLSGLPDTPDNYYIVTYELEEKNGGTELTVTQLGQMKKETADHSRENWKNILEKLKEIVEKSKIEFRTISGRKSSR